MHLFMRKTFYFLTVCALVLTIVSCGHKADVNTKKISRVIYTDEAKAVVDSAFYTFVWDNDQIASYTYSNPYGNDLDYNAKTTYQDGRVSVIDDDQFHVEITYIDGRMAQVTQSSHDGVRLHQLVFNYTGDDCAEVTLNSMSKEAIQWIEAIVYDKRDTMGNEVRHPMPQDTALHPSSVSQYRWKDGNLVSVSSEYIDGGFSVSTTFEYDQTTNPFYQHCVGFNRLDVVNVAVPFGDNYLGLSKNNITKIKAVVTTAEAEAATVARQFAYTYEDGHPVSTTEVLDKHIETFVYE